ncbi:MAG: hypothetical protein CR976_00020, partial [Thiotrichales bacterium]
MAIRCALFGVCLVFCLSGCGEQEAVVVTPPAMVDKHADTAELAALLPVEPRQPVPELSAYRERVAAALKSELPVLLLPDAELSDPKARLAQRLILRSPQFRQRLFHPQTRVALRNEIMSVRPALAADFNGNMGACKQAECYRIEMYSHFFNASTIVFVDVNSQRVLGMGQQSYSQ